MKENARFKDPKHSLSLFGWLQKVVTSFSFTEKIVFSIAAGLFLLIGLTMLLNVNKAWLIEIPKFGGTYTEGVVGTPRFVNPVLAISDTDKDLVSLIYSGLMRLNENGELTSDLASSYTVSEDGYEYLFVLRDDITFHDGEHVTADDVVFTIEQIQNPTIKSPQRANWEGVVAEKVSDTEVRFILPQPFPAFLFNTTLGILPEHIWESVAAEEFPFAERNVNPIGSGPYKIERIKKTSAGITTQYELSAFDDFVLGKPNIESFVVSFFKNEDDLVTALHTGAISGAGSISPAQAKELIGKGYTTKEFPLPRVFGVFFNQSQAPTLASKTVRRALATAVDREQLVDEVLDGYGTAAEGPIPFAISPFPAATSTESSQPTEDAIGILIDAGFSVNEETGVMEQELDAGTRSITFTLATADVPELIEAGNQVVASWRAIGADVTLKVFDPGSFGQNIIRPRQYDAILFGEVIGRDIDLYPFWHSSQRNDPGLNIADYANIDADAALEDARVLPNGEEKNAELATVITEIENDVPAIFLYSPNYIYTTAVDVQGVLPAVIVTPSERFSMVHTWYLETDTVWEIFNTST